MGVVRKRLLRGSSAPVACALAALWPAPAHAASDIKLFTAETLEINGGARIVAVDGERSWVTGDLGKLRSGSSGDMRVRPELGNVNLIWQPQMTWSLSATVVGTLQGGQHTEAGLSQAFLSFKPMRGSKVAFSARAGLMWPAVSLEHEGADWHVSDSITPSAINSWIGEEVKLVGLEGTAAHDLGEAEIAATLGIAVGSVGVLLARAERAFREGYRERFADDGRPELSASSDGPSKMPLREDTDDLHMP